MRRMKCYHGDLKNRFMIFLNISRICGNYTSMSILYLTMPTEVLTLTDQFMKDAIRILVKNEELTLEGIKQYFVAVEKDIWKLDTLRDIYKYLTVDQAIIYTNTKRKAEWFS